MLTSATGKPTYTVHRRTWLPAHQGGFTLLELMIVVAIVGIASAAVAFALRDSAENQLDREAQRLVALLESARAESRATGVVLVWQATAQGFEFRNPHDNTPPGTGNNVLNAAGNRQANPPARPTQWEREGVQAASEAPIVLGPEPVIGPQNIRLWMRDAPERSRWVSTDGLRAFTVRNTLHGVASTAPGPDNTGGSP